MKPSIKQEIQLKCFLKVIFCNVEEMMFHTVIESDAMYARLRTRASRVPFFVWPQTHGARMAQSENETDSRLDRQSRLKAD